MIWCILVMSSNLINSAIWICKGGHYMTWFTL